MNLEIIEKNSFFAFPTSIHFGVEIRQKLVQCLQQNGLSTPLIVTDRGIADTPIIPDLTELLKSSGLNPKVFSEIWGNPVKSQVLAGVEQFKNDGADSIVAVGGGAALDVAKVIALMVHHPGDLFDYEDGKMDARPVDQKIPLIVALPTTAGTGSEVGRSSVISDDKTKQKKIIYSPRLLPSEVFIDPELCLSLPANMTAATGLDALTHLIEAYLSIGFHPMCDGIALQGVKLVAENIENAYEFAKKSEGNTKEHLYARGMLMNAAMMGAVAFQKGLGVNHSCAHALSTVCDLHHGVANGIILPFCMEYNLVSVPEKFDDLAKATGQITEAKEFIPWLEDLKKKLDIPEYLTGAGVTMDHLPQLVQVAMEDVCHQSNPRTLSPEDFENIFRRALGEE